jgi:hypothetical protein
MANANFNQQAYNFPSTFVGSPVQGSWSDSIGNFLGGGGGWDAASAGLGFGSAIGDYFGNMEKIKNQEEAYKRSVDVTQRSLMGLLGRGELVGQSDNARVVGRNQPTGMPGNMTGGQSFYDRILAPGTILSGGPGQGGIDPQQIQARTMLARLMSNDPFSGQQMQGMYGEQNRQLGRGLGGPASGNLQQDLQGLLNFGGAGQARAGLGMQLGAAGAQSRRQGALGASQYLGNVYGAAGRAVG